MEGKLYKLQSSSCLLDKIRSFPPLRKSFNDKHLNNPTAIYPKLKKKEKIIDILVKDEPDNKIKQNLETSSFKAPSRLDYYKTVAYIQKKYTNSSADKFYDVNYQYINKKVVAVKFVKAKKSINKNTANSCNEFHNKIDKLYSSFSTYHGIKFQNQLSRRKHSPSAIDTSLDFCNSEKLNSITLSKNKYILYRKLISFDFSKALPRRNNMFTPYCPLISYDYNKEKILPKITRNIIFNSKKNISNSKI